MRVLACGRISQPPLFCTPNFPYPHCGLCIACFPPGTVGVNMGSMTEPLNSESRIVAIETSSRVGSVAVARGAHLLAARRFSQSMRHAVELMPGIADLTREQGWKPTDIQQIYVSIGPGSFTGVRIAIAVARAISQSTGARLIAVPTLDVLAANAPADTTNLAVILDAKRGQVYASRYGRQRSASTAASTLAAAGIGPANLFSTAGPVLTDPAEFIRASPRPLLILGEGIPYHHDALVAGGLGSDGVHASAESLWQPAASQVHALGWQRALAGRFTALEEFLPIYIRKAEAEELLEKKQALL